MIHFDLSELVDELGVTVKVARETKGYYDDYGDWIDGETETKEIKAILSRDTDDTMTYYDSGSLRADYYKIYTNDKLNRDDKIIYSNKTFTLYDHRDYDTLARPHIYFLKWRDKDEI